MRTIWKGSISFGLVNIPIAVYPATREERVSFKQLRKGDLSPIRYKKVAEVDDKEVRPENIVKGYEFAKEKWVTLDEKDFEAVEIPSTHTIEITDFVSAEEINPKFFHTPYFLEALKGGEKGYTLLHRALTETGKVGIAKVAIRSREYLAAVKPDGLFLILDLMHFADEVRDASELKPAGQREVSPRELQMAKQLIDSMTGPWEPEKYKDEYRDALMAMISAKMKNLPPAPKGSRQINAGDVADLVAILQQSLTKAGEKKTQSPSRPRGPVKTSSLLKSKRGGAAVGMN